MNDFGDAVHIERLRKIHTIEHGFGHRNRAERSLYPAFWSAIHEAWNAVCDQFEVLVVPDLGGHPLPKGLAAMPRCPGQPEGTAYDPEQHPFCFDLAQSLRVSLHAAGVRVTAGRSIE